MSVTHFLIGGIYPELTVQQIFCNPDWAGDCIDYERYWPRRTRSLPPPDISLTILSSDPNLQSPIPPRSASLESPVSARRTIEHSCNELILALKNKEYLL
jgi:hypothetical protein